MMKGLVINIVTLALAAAAAVFFFRQGLLAASPFG
jgi:hypothetical protein